MGSSNSWDSDLINEEVQVLLQPSDETNSNLWVWILILVIIMLFTTSKCFRRQQNQEDNTYRVKTSP